jgi:DNA polymerase-3 subunit gamma/tau
MSETLYRKYRPQKFSEIIGQKHIVQTLSNALKNNRVGQAYLFTGPRGTGKTTMARLLAKAINCANLVSEERAGTKLSIRREADTSFVEPCGQCKICKNIADGRSLDVIEIDAASNTGVDNIRELRETVNLPPTEAKYKVYIIDEVHMLSTGAWNALLKTLEEPPAHVVFILATTEIHKVPETVLSRVQRFDFARLPMENIIEKLVSIAEKEKIKVKRDALEMIALSAEGGMRDAESLFAQVIALEDKNITAKEVEEILGTSDHQLIEKMANLVLAKKTNEGLELVNQIANDGFDLEIFCKALLNYFRQVMIISVDPKLVSAFSFELTSEQKEKIKALASETKTQDILLVIDAFLEAKTKIKSSFIPQLPLEIAIVKSTTHGTWNMEHETEEIKSISKKENQPPVISNQSSPSPVATRQEITKEEKIEPIPTVPEETIKYDNKKIIEIFDIRNRWNDVLASIKPLNHSLILFLSNCQPTEIENNHLTIATQYSFYKDKLNEMANKLTIEGEFAKIFESKIKITFTDTGYEPGNNIAPAPVSAIEKTSNDPAMNEAMKLFGGKIVEE